MRLITLIIATIISSCSAQTVTSAFDLVQANKKKTLLQADNYIKDMIGDQNFRRHLSRPLSYCSIDSDSNFAYTSYEDSVKFIPTKYKVRYLIQIDSIEYDQITIEFNSRLENQIDSTHYTYFDLIGWRNIMNKTYKTSPNDVYAIVSEIYPSIKWNKPKLNCSRNDIKQVPLFYY